MAGRRRSAAESGEADTLGAGIARAVGGALIFAVPMLMTSELWQLGFSMDRRRLALLVVLSIPLLVGVAHRVGFEPTFGWREDLRDAFLALGIGAAAAAAILGVFNLLRPGMPATELVGKTAVQAVPAALGALLARSQFGGTRAGGRDTGTERALGGYAGALFLMVVGARGARLTIGRRRHRMFTVTGPDGTAIACWQGGTGPNLVLVHGTAASHSRWSSIRPRFEAHFTVTAVDRRGRGGSGDAPDYAVEREFEDVAAVVEALGPPTLLFGHSYGGLCALGAALRTDRLTGLVLYEPPIVGAGESFYAPGLLERMDGLLAAGDREGLLTAMFVEIVGASPRELELLRASPAWPDRLAAAHTILRECRAEDAYRLDHARLRALAVPVLLLLGGDSPPLFAGANAALEAALPAARTVVMPGQQHVAMDTGPELVVEAVLDFWRETRPGS